MGGYECEMVTSLPGGKIMSEVNLDLKVGATGACVHLNGALEDL